MLLPVIGRRDRALVNRRSPPESGTSGAVLVAAAAAPDGEAVVFPHHADDRAFDEGDVIVLVGEGVDEARPPR